MPPLPATFNPDTTALIDALNRRQRDLRNFQLPRLRACAGPLAVQQQYAGEVREDMDVLARGVETLDAAVDDQSGERNRRALRAVVEELREALASLKKESRAALLASKRAIDAQGASNREELLRSSAVREKQDLNEKVAEDALMTASNNVTEALQRTISLMQGELEKSVLSTQLLDQSTATLKSASSTHDVLDGLMATSKHLITALEKSDWLDRLLVLAALAFFVLVVLFILKQRLVDRSLRIAFWWTRFLPASSSSSAARAAEGVADALEKGAVTASVTDVAAAVSTALTAASTVVATALSSPSPPIPSDAAPPVEADSTNTLSEILSQTISPEGEEEAIDILAPTTDATLPDETHVPIAAHDEL